jgi:hypothetical protein
VQVAASALAAVTAALVSSTFGVAGTLIGTAIASVFASVGSTLYWASLHRTNEQLRRVAVAARRTDWGGAFPTRPVRTAVAERPPPPEEPAVVTASRWSNLRRGLPTLRRRWLAVAGLTALVFVVALAVLTAIQASSNQRLTALPASTSHSKPAPTPSVTPRPSPSPSATPTPSPSESVTPSPTESASPTPSAPPSSAAGGTPSPSAAPSVGASPAPSPTAATVP